VERLEALPRVLLVGRPNAGKSALFNGLTGLDRAIQSATAGTTRDVLVAPLCVPGGEVVLLDSAGLCVETDQLNGNAGVTPNLAAGTDLDQGDDPTALAEAATRRSIVTADLILLIVDATDSPLETTRSLQSLMSQRPHLLVLNKIDAATAPTSGLPEFEAAVRVSARTGEGLAMLRERVGQKLFANVETHGSDLLALSTRQRSALGEARDALRRAIEICRNSPETSNSVELLALETREAIHALSLLTGEIATEELLGRIFSRFCIGK